MNKFGQFILVFTLLPFCLGLCLEPSAIGANSRPGSKGPAFNPAPAIRDKWAVVIGIERFADTTVPRLKFGRKNASDLASLLTDPKIGRFAPDHVTTVTGTSATKQGIEAALSTSWLLKKALPNDLIVLYFATRALPSKDGKELYLFAYDTLASDEDSSGLGLLQLLKETKHRIQSRSILCLLDTSPGVQPGASAPARTPSVEELTQSSGVSIFAASRLDQASNQSQAAAQSYFLHYLSEGLKAGAGLLPLQVVSQYVTQKVQEDVSQSEGKQQTPEFATAADNPSFAQISLGVLVKSSVPARQIAVGHPVDDLHLSRPDLARPRVPGQPVGQDEPANAGAHSPNAGKAEAEDEDDEHLPGANVDFGAYMAKMKRDIQKKWQPPRGFENRKIVTVFGIRRDGTIVEPAIVEGSGVEAIDRSALDALNAASPLDPLPPGAPKLVQIRYQFDWKVNRN